MRKQIKKLVAVVLTLLIVAGTFSPIKADAESISFKFTEKSLWFGQNGEDKDIFDLISLSKGHSYNRDVVISVKSKNPKVIKIIKRKSKTYSEGVDYLLHPLKTGKSKIVVKYKSGKKTKTISAVITVKDFPNPVESLEINGKKINVKKYNVLAPVLKNYTSGKITIKIKLKDGWELDMDGNIDFWGKKQKNGTQYLGNEKLLKGKTIKLEKNADHSINIACKNTETGKYIAYHIKIYPKIKK